MRKRVFSLVLALAMILLVTGCGGSSAPATSSSPAETKTETAQESATVPEITEAQESEPAWEVVSSGVSTQTSSIGSVWYSAWIEVTNTGNTPLYLGTMDVDIENASSQMVHKISMMGAYPQVLLPGETGVYYDAGTLDDGIETEGLKLHGKPGIEKARVDCIRYDVEDITIKTNDYKQTNILGRVVNNTDKDTDGMVYVSALCYDENNSLLGLMFTIITDPISAGDYTGIDMTSFGYDFEADSVASTVAYAYLYQYQF